MRVRSVNLCLLYELRKNGMNGREREEKTPPFTITIITVKLIKPLNAVIAFYLQLTNVKRMIQLKNLINNPANVFHPNV